MRFPTPDGGPVLVVGPLRRSWRREAASAGWEVVADDCPGEPWELAGVVVCTRDPQTAALAIARGGGAVFLGDSGSADTADLMEDVERVGATIWRSDVDSPSAGSEPDDDVADLMAALIDGESVAAAARTACMSLRTAQRRLDVLRKRYGVTTTAGVVAVWAREHGSGSSGEGLA